MPYIEQKLRDNLVDGKPITPGELNYIVTKACNDYIAMRGLSYTHINDVVGALEGAKLEFYRRVAAPYEDIKSRANGEVYTCIEEKA